MKDDLQRLRVRNWFGLAQDQKTSCFTFIKHYVLYVPTVFQELHLSALHKCFATCKLSVNEQPGARQCSVCQRWFKSARGLAVP